LAEWKKLFIDSMVNVEKMSVIKLKNPITDIWNKANTLTVNYLSLHKRPHSKDTEEDLELALLAGLIQLHFPLETIQEEIQSPVMKWMLGDTNH
jgi:hypothetical protein